MAAEPAMQFTPVRLGSIVIRDPMQLKAAFPDEQVYTALMEYFPATKGRPVLQSIPDDVAETLIRAFKQRIQGLRSVSSARMSKMNGSKNEQSITELVHMIVALQGRNLRPSSASGKAPAKKLRKKIQAMPPDKKRELIFKLLWDLLHPTTEREEINKSWDVILEEITSKEPYKLVLPSTPAQPLEGEVNLGALTAGDEAGGLAQFTKRTASPSSTVSVSPADQLKTVYAISHLFGIEFDRATTPKAEPLIKKLAEILNAYTAFYATRYPFIIRTGFLYKFYGSVNKKYFNENTLLTLYKSITTILTDPKGYIYPTANKSAVLIKISGFSDIEYNIQDLIKAYTEAVIIAGTESGKTKTNQIVREELSTDLNKLYSINVLDTKVAQIIASQRINYKINEIPTSYEVSEKEEIKARAEQIKVEAGSYFTKTNDTLYIVFTPSKLIEQATVTAPAIQRLYTYTNGTVTDGIPALKTGDKSAISLIAPNNVKYIDVSYTPTQVYQSFTMPILQLLTLIHLKETIKSPPAAKKPMAVSLTSKV